MRKLSFIAAFAAFAICGGTSLSFAGVNLKSGSLEALKSEKSMKVQYDYSNMKIGKDETEEQYTSKKVAEHNQKEPGKGDAWLKAWVGAREQRYQPKFQELFNKTSESRQISETNNNAKYTLIVKTIHTEPGFNVGVMKRPSSVDFVFHVVETANPTNIIAELTLDNVPGSQAMGYDYDAGSRIAESYAKAGKMLGKFFESKIK